MSEILTANQAWRNSNSSLAFKDWLSKEKAKGVFIKNETLSSIVDESKIATGVSKEEDKKVPSNKILGINKTVILLSSVVIVMAIGFRYYQNSKS